MTTLSLVTAVKLHTGKIIKNIYTVFLKDEKIYYKVVYYTLYLR